MHFPMTGKIYLHDDDVFALDINFLRFVGYLQPWDKPSNDIFSEKKHKKMSIGHSEDIFLVNGEKGINFNLKKNIE